MTQDFDMEIAEPYRAGYNPEFVERVLKKRNFDSSEEPKPEKVPMPHVRIRGVPSWVSNLINRTAEEFELWHPGEIVSRNTSRDALRARAKVAYECRRKDVNISFTQIAKWLRRDHTSILNLVARHAAGNGLPDLTGLDLKAKAERARKHSAR